MCVERRLYLKKIHGAMIDLKHRQGLNSKNLSQ